MSLSTPSAFTISFQLTRRELYSALVAISKANILKPRILVGTVIGIVLFSLLLGLGMSRADTIKFGVMWGGIYVPLFYLFLCYGQPYFVARSLYKNSADFRGTSRYSFSDDDITWEGITARSECSWSTFIEVRETKEFFLFYILKGSARVVPKHAFGSEQEIVEFRELVRRRAKQPLLL